MEFTGSSESGSYSRSRALYGIGVALGAFIHVAISQANSETGVLEEINVAATPIAGLTPNMQRLPYSIQRAVAAQLRGSNHLDFTDYANSRLGSVNINSAQNNPLQPDLQYRGFTASPLLGLPQGMTLYQNGARINEPLGDAVNWDLLPVSAVQQMTVHSGANPVFGLNTLGGSLVAVMKNGFNFEGVQLDASAGSWNRQRAIVEYGSNNGTWGYYVNVDGMREDGWRDLSDSETLRWYGSVSWRHGDRSALNIALQQGDSDLTGNGASPVGLLQEDRSAVFTAPDVTENNMHMLSVDGFHFFSDRVQLAGTFYYRHNDTDSFNGDASELESCEFSDGTTALLEDAEEIEALLEKELDIELDDICEGEIPEVGGFVELQELIERRALLAGLAPERFELDDISGDFPVGSPLTDEAINNISNRRQISQGLELQLTMLHEILGLDNSLVLGVGYHDGKSRFRSVTELAELDSQTRSTRGLGSGLFLEEESVQVRTHSEISSLYFANTLRLSDALSLTVAGRFNRSDITLRDRSGERPELNGDHRFSRFNPSLGVNYALAEEHFLYASYSESSRAPTPIELACNEGVFEVARQFAEARGDDPDDIDFECRLPNAFLADPPLQQVVARSMEIGSRGDWRGLKYSLGLFDTRNRNDILFQSTGRATGLFANVNETRRRGLEVSFSGAVRKLDWSLHYSWIDATFAADMAVLSPNHVYADEAGEIQVDSGDRIPGIPAHLLKLSGRYHFTSRLNLGAEIVYNSDQVLRGDESNQQPAVEGFGLFNLSAAYEANEQLRFYLRVDNVLDSEYENFGLLGEDPSEVIDGIENRSPVFLGAGAPRAAWLGVQLRM